MCGHLNRTVIIICHIMTVSRLCRVSVPGCSALFRIVTLILPVTVDLCDRCLQVESWIELPLCRRFQVSSDINTYTLGTQ